MQKIGLKKNSLELLFKYLSNKNYLMKIIPLFLDKNNKIIKFICTLGMGDWGWGIGDWGLGPIPNPPSPIPNPPSPKMCK